MMAKSKLQVLTLKNFALPKWAEPDFYVKTFQQHKTEHPFVMEPHSHDFYLLMLITKGSGTHTIEQNEYKVKPGSLFFMSPSEVHSWKLDDQTEGYILFFNVQFYLMDIRAKTLFDLPFYNASNKKRSGMLAPAQLKEFGQIIQTIIYESSKPSIHQKRILRSYLDILLLKLDAVLEQENKNVKTQVSSVILQLQALIEQYFNAHKPASFYASELKLSLPQLNSITRSSLNKTVVEMIHERMISEAKRLLAYSSLTVNEISYQLNFNDNSYFNRFFKKAVSLTPEQFRKQLLMPQNDKKVP
ncbi:MAG: AraC family transcriptional regulator [Bacteroidota bacterium]